MGSETNERQRQPPFDRWPVGHFDAHYGYAWYCGKGLIVSHLTTRHGTETAAVAYHDFEESVLATHAREIAENRGLFVIHDWRKMQTYDPGARRVWQARMQARPKGYLRGSIVCVSKAGPLLRMAVQAANLVASVAHGAKVELCTDLDAALREHRVVPPGASRTMPKLV
ncbi:MAG TPA: hypothetical protein VK524_29700 [Polyangiaceae bacterium]|nr:hypothetical protein [Polyangiaceae bacterium]